MKIQFTSEFIKAVRKNPLHWKEPEIILANRIYNMPAEIKIHGLLYKVGKEVEIVNEKKWWQFWKTNT